MDMLKYKSFIEEGDLVIVYIDVKHMYPITITRDEVFQCKYGALKHDDLVGKRFGSCISCTKGYVYVLFPTPELWTITLPHRTQILYAADISLIVMQLELRPGSIVCEAGTGSGSLSHALARAIAPNGFLYTFDFHEKRAEIAQKEFNSHGLGEIVKVEHRDVCANGFGVSGEADALFLDLPNPWDVIQHAVKALKPSGSRICSFSPCIEQVQRTCKAMLDCNFLDITTVECLQRTFEVKKITQSVVSFSPRKDDNKRSCSDAQANENLPSSSSQEGPAQNSNMKKNTSSNDCETVTHWTAMPPLQTPGHTGYLTYASYCSS